MAKQSGLHQIRGKVGEHSYYRQTGVSTGLIRSINQGLSARVKTAPEYANTRLLNAEFGQACRVAAAAIRSILPKYRPMILPFSQAKMAKLVYNEITSNAGVWGRRGINDVEGEKISAYLNTLAKNSVSEWGLFWQNQQGEPGQTLSALDPLFSNKMSSIGADGAEFRVFACNLWQGTWQTDTGTYANSYMRLDTESLDESTAFHDDVELSMPSDPPTGWPATSIHFFLVVVLPYKTVNSSDYILQEHCTFVAIPRNYQEGPLS